MSVCVRVCMCVCVYVYMRDKYASMSVCIML